MLISDLAKIVNVISEGVKGVGSCPLERSLRGRQLSLKNGVNKQWQ